MPRDPPVTNAVFPRRSNILHLLCKESFKPLRLCKQEAVAILFKGFVML
jgi:hypothetical protein